MTGAFFEGRGVSVLKQCRVLSYAANPQPHANHYPLSDKSLKEYLVDS